MRPIIGVTSNYSDDDMRFVAQGLGARGQEWSVIANDYSDAIIEAGGIPVVIPITEDEEYLEKIADLIDGLLLTGGADINPLLAGQRPDEKTGRIAPQRDSQEMILLDYFYNKTKKPILGICRGMQFLNVFFNGSLILDLPRDGYLPHTLINNERYFPSHSVEINEDSILREIFESDSIMVNSFHHQAVGNLGEKLKASGKSEDGVIEAMEYHDLNERFILAVQWHPEMMSIADEDHQRIFEYFVNEAKPK